MADPSGTPTFRDLAGAGSDTTQGVMNALSNVVTIGGIKVLGSYDAATAPSQTMSTKSTPACTNITRPSGSGAGVNALVASQQAGDGCLQFARSSANDSASRTGQNLTYIPFAVDALAYATRTGTSIPKSLTTAQLQSVYNCANASIQPMLPQFGSGTRKFFLASLGFTDAADFTSQTGHTCIKQTDANGNPLLENTGNLLTAANQIEPYSISQYIAQSSREEPDVHGNTALGEINGILPLLLNNSSTMTREVFNIVPNSQIGAGTETNQVFVGPTSLVCSNGSTIQRLGFGTDTNCGSTTIQTP
jgi:ABC-type phosphate transport system substrate-binding protein